MNENILNIYLFNGLYGATFIYTYFWNSTIKIDVFFWKLFIIEWNENVWHILVWKMKTKKIILKMKLWKAVICLTIYFPYTNFGSSGHKKIFTWIDMLSSQFFLCCKIKILELEKYSWTITSLPFHKRSITSSHWKTFEDRKNEDEFLSNNFCFERSFWFSYPVSHFFLFPNNHDNDAIII